MALDIFMRPWISFEWITKLFALGREMKRRVSVVQNFTKQVCTDETGRFALLLIIKERNFVH